MAIQYWWLIHKKVRNVCGDLTNVRNPWFDGSPRFICATVRWRVSDISQWVHDAIITPLLRRFDVIITLSINAPCVRSGIRSEGEIRCLFHTWGVTVMSGPSPEQTFTNINMYKHKCHFYFWQKNKRKHCDVSLEDSCSCVRTLVNSFT